MHIDSEKYYEIYSDFCKAIAYPMRLKIIDVLKDERKSLGQLLAELGTTKANLSQHLKILRQQGIISSGREGSTVYYSISNSNIAEVSLLIKKLLVERLKEEMPSFLSR